LGGSLKHYHLTLAMSLVGMVVDGVK
jgi:hypothetical protein